MKGKRARSYTILRLAPHLLSVVSLSTLETSLLALAIALGGMLAAKDPLASGRPTTGLK